MLLLLSTSPAVAMPAFNCDGLDIVGTVPHAGAMDVPADVRPAVVYGPGDGCPFESETATLTDADGNVVSTWFGEEDPRSTWLLEVFPSEGLLSDASYVLTATPSEGEAVEVGFTTGTGTVAGITGLPTITVGEGTWNPTEVETQVGGRATFEVEITPGTDPDGLSVVQVRDADQPTRAIRSYRVTGDAPVTATLSWENRVRLHEVCPQVRQVDGTGFATKWSEARCAEVTGGCSTAGGAPTLGLVLLGALFSRRRRAE